MGHAKNRPLTPHTCTPELSRGSGPMGYDGKQKRVLWENSLTTEIPDRRRYHPTFNSSSKKNPYFMTTRYQAIILQCFILGRP